MKDQRSDSLSRHRDDQTMFWDMSQSCLSLSLSLCRRVARGDPPTYAPIDNPLGKYRSESTKHSHSSSLLLLSSGPMSSS